LPGTLKKYFLLFFILYLLTSGTAQQSSCQEPKYNNQDFWAASPFKYDTSDSIPEFLSGEKRDIRADLFFIHPTSFFAEGDSVALNASLSDREVNQTTDYRSILFQATAFNGSCRVFAPRYRQANMKAFYIMGTPEAKKAFDLAYQDVKKSFQWYLKEWNQGRPIVIASHSQGTLHAIRLVKEFFDGRPLAEKLVCAYLIGYPVYPESFRKLPVGEAPGQTGCYVSWRSYLKGEFPKKTDAEKMIPVCVNPLTWTTSANPANAGLHRGIMLGFDAVFPNTVETVIEPGTGILWIDPKVPIEGAKGTPKNLHTYDINLFWMNIRENVRERIEAWYNRHSLKDQPKKIHSGNPEQ